MSAKKSDTRAKLSWFTTVILPHERAMRLYLRSRVANAEDADDFASEALLRAYSTKDWARITSGRAFLFTIARNLTIDAARRNKIVAFDGERDPDTFNSAIDVERHLHARDELRRLERIIAGFPRQCRRAFILRRVEQKSFAEVADEMGLSVTTVEKHVAKALGLLMRSEMLREEPCHDDSAGSEWRSRQGA